MEATTHPLSCFYPTIPPDTLTAFSGFVKASFGQEPDPTQFSTRVDFEKGVLSEVEAELHKAPLTEETIEKCSFFVFSFFFEDTKFDYNNMYDVAAQVRDLSILLRVLPTQIPNKDDDRHFVADSSDESAKLIYLLKMKHNSRWYGVPIGGEKKREELFYLIDQKFLQGNVVPPTYQCEFSQCENSGTLHRYVPYERLTAGNDRSFWDAPQVRMNALLHLLVNYMDEARTNYGVTGSRPFRLVSFDGESILSCNLRAGPRKHPLLTISATKTILDDPFSPEEISLVESIDAKQLESFLQERDIAQAASYITICALKTLRQAISRQKEGAEDPITLRDLVVIFNISKPFALKDLQGNLYPDKNTCFYEIWRGFDAELRIREVFASIVEVKKKAAGASAASYNPYKNSVAPIDRQINRHVWDYYREHKVKQS